MVSQDLTAHPGKLAGAQALIYKLVGVVYRG